MPKRPDYRQQLKAELSSLIDGTQLAEFQKALLRARWLDQLLWMEGRADAARDWYYRLRLTTIIGGVVLPALVTLVTKVPRLEIATVALSVLIASSAAIEEFFHYGERWRHYRRSVERLKAEGWLFFQLSAHYRRFRTHADAYALFTARVEDIIQRDVEQYVTTVTPEKQEEPKTKMSEQEAEGGVAHGVS